MNLLFSKVNRASRLFQTLSLIWLLLAQAPPDSLGHQPSSAAAGVDQAELHQALLDLTNTATVMCIAAHPDDEDGTTLTVLRRKYGVHTVSLFSTFGEGGQNAVGPELYEELGVIRERETREAAAIQGSEPHFLGLKDFGYSKTAEETFRVWGHDEALRRMVLKIRELRPDVIITNHDTTTGHGHHQATGRLALEAFEAAADAKRFPEQPGTGSVWQAKRLFVRTRPPAANNTTAPTAPTTNATAEKLVTIDPNERDPIRGTMYAEQALAALQRHASQGPWPASIAERLRGNPSGKLPLIRYRLAREATGVTTFSAEAKTFLDGLETVPQRPPPKIDGRELTEILDQPDRILNALIDWRRRTGNGSSLESEPQRARLMVERVDRALAVAAGIGVAIVTRTVVLVPGTPTTLTVNVSNAGSRTVQLKKLSFTSWGKKVELEAAEQLSADTETSNAIDLVTPSNVPLSVPQSSHLYDGKLSGQPFLAEAALEVDGARFSVSAKRYIDVAPAVEIKNVSPSPYVSTPNTTKRPLSLKLTLINHTAAPFRGVLKLRGPRPQPFEVGRLLMLDPLQTTERTLDSNALPGAPSSSERNGVETDPVLSVLAADSSLVTERPIRLVTSDARVNPKLKVGYLPSFDTTLEQSLDALGVAATKLSVKNIQNDDLKGFETIIIDNRGYYAHPELIAANSRLFSFVQEGGTLIVFYHKDGEWNPNADRGRPQLAPYPIILSDDRVTEEVAPIRFLQPKHPLLNYPNKISNTDFNNWIQERGLYYPREWDDHYTPLFASNDTGEKPLSGGLLVAKYGRGNYIFTSMVWYRQLAAGVPGAYRMLANMISYGTR